MHILFLGGSCRPRPLAYRATTVSEQVAFSCDPLTKCVPTAKNPAEAKACTQIMDSQEYEIIDLYLLLNLATTPNLDQGPL